MHSDDVLRPAEARELAAVGAGVARQSSAENFPVALRVLPARPRAHLNRIYAYARFVDDVGDEATGDRKRLLDLIDTDVRALRGGTPALRPVADLRPTVEECDVPLEPLLALIEANRVDQRVTRYASFDDLLGYCQLSAAPVGQLVLHVAGAATERNIADSDAVCAALQVLEHCQDVGEDARAGRVYLPADDLHAAGVMEDQLRAAVTTTALRGVVGRQVERAAELLTAGAPLVGRLTGWAKIAVAGYVAGGTATAHALRRARFDVLGRPIRPSRPRTTVDALRLLARR
jgi:squalene synthase HpnC